MKVIAVLSTLLALCHGIAVVDQSNNVPVCQAVPSSCRLLGQATAKKCSSIIASQNIPLSKCRRAQRTVTTTQTLQPTVFRTSSIRATTIVRTTTTTTTKWGPTVTLSPTTIPVTETSTSLITTTLVSSTVTTTTTISTATSSELTTITTTTQARTTLPWSIYQCPTVVRPPPIPSVIATLIPTLVPRNLRRYRDASPTIKKSEDSSSAVNADLVAHELSALSELVDLTPRADLFPNECSCYLTSTLLEAPPQTSAKTVTRPVTHTRTTIIGGLVPTTTTTTTIRRTTSIPGTTHSRSTVFKTSTTTLSSTITERTTDTSTRTQTSLTTTTTTSVTETTATQVVATDAATWGCDNIQNLQIPGTPYNPVVYEGNGFMRLDGSLTEFLCCKFCWENYDCAWWRFQGSSSSCQLYSVNSLSLVQGACNTDACRKGFPDVQVTPSDGKTYHLGKCAGKYV